jgi:hypothetical protein
LKLTGNYSAAYNRKKLTFFIKSWHVAVNLFGDISLYYILAAVGAVIFSDTPTFAKVV